MLKNGNIKSESLKRFFEKNEKYYKVFLLNVASQFLFHQDFPFLLCSVINGSGSLNDIPIHKGMHFILSYHYGNVLLKGNLSFICSTIPTTT